MKDSTLPRHARNGLVAVGWRKPRPGEEGPQPIWPVLGGAPVPPAKFVEPVEPDDDGDGDDDKDDVGDQGDDTDDGDDTPEGADQLGDAGKKALDSMKGKYRSERDRRKAAETELAQLKASQGKKPEGDGGGDGPDLEQIRADARAEAKAEGLRERALDRLEARAARKFANPEVARRLLAHKVEDFVDGDSIDTTAITDALEDLLVSDPYLGSEQAKQDAKRFKDDGDGGPRGKAPKGQLTERDLEGMTPSQINTARREGRLDNLMGKTK
ncbi:hypothetical protein [Streptomyces sp. NPDC087317]|uniref:hypothetical protein n=1 Tax=Streptomyces sp. NPDC087317 TaxID=3365784 RepID=UPI0037FAC262